MGHVLRIPSDKVVKHFILLLTWWINCESCKITNVKKILILNNHEFTVIQFDFIKSSSKINAYAYISFSFTVKIIFKVAIRTLFPVNLLTKFVWSRPLSARSCFIRFTMLACLYSAAASMAVWPYKIKHCIEGSHLFIFISSVNFIWMQFKISSIINKVVKNKVFTQQEQLFLLCYIHVNWVQCE